MLFRECTLFLRVYLILRVHLFYPEYESRAHQGWSIPPPRVRVGWGEGRKSLPFALPLPYLWWALDTTEILMLSDINYIYIFWFWCIQTLFGSRLWYQLSWNIECIRQGEIQLPMIVSITVNARKLFYCRILVKACCSSWEFRKAHALSCDRVSWHLSLPP